MVTSLLSHQLPLPETLHQQTPVLLFELAFCSKAPQTRPLTQLTFAVAPRFLFRFSHPFRAPTLFTCYCHWSISASCTILFTFLSPVPSPYSLNPVLLLLRTLLNDYFKTYLEISVLEYSVFAPTWSFMLLLSLLCLWSHSVFIHKIFIREACHWIWKLCSGDLLYQ